MCLFRYWDCQENLNGLVRDVLSVLICFFSKWVVGLVICSFRSRVYSFLSSTEVAQNLKFYHKKVLWVATPLK